MRKALTAINLECWPKIEREVMVAARPRRKGARAMFCINDRVSVTFPQCAPNPGNVRGVLAHGKTLMIEWDGHAQNVPYLWVRASACELIGRSTPNA